MSSVQRPPAAAREARGFVQANADLSGVAPVQLRDSALLSGLVIAAAGAAGLAAVGAPVVRQMPDDGVAAWMPLDRGHISVRSFPDRDLILVDVIARSADEARKVVDVFTRRLVPRDVQAATHLRG